MSRRYSLFDWIAVAGLTFMAYPDPTDVPTFGLTNLIGIAGLYMFYPDVLQKVGLK